MRGATTRRRAVSSFVLAGILVVAAGIASAPAAGPGHHRRARDLDLAASANPSAADPVVTDEVFSDDSAFRRAVRSDATATSSAICDGCDATGTALQVVYVHHGRKTSLDNTAVAWTQSCTDCRANSVSVQVVVMRGVPSIVANNRALAVNAACASCEVGSVAFQLVVSSRRAERLSDDALDEIRAWIDDQVAALRTAPAPAARSSRHAHKKAERRAQRVAGRALVTLEDLINGDLGTDTVSSDVDVSR